MEAMGLLEKIRKLEAAVKLVVSRDADYGARIALVEERCKALQERVSSVSLPIESKRSFQTKGNESVTLADCVQKLEGTILAVSEKLVELEHEQSIVDAKVLWRFDSIESNLATLVSDLQDQGLRVKSTIDRSFLSPQISWKDMPAPHQAGGLGSLWPFVSRSASPRRKSLSPVGSGAGVRKPRRKASHSDVADGGGDDDHLAGTFGV